MEVNVLLLGNVKKVHYTVKVCIYSFHHNGNLYYGNPLVDMTRMHLYIETCTCLDMKHIP